MENGATVAVMVDGRLRSASVAGTSARPLGSSI
jgi:hypothetical protein